MGARSKVCAFIFNGCQRGDVEAYLGNRFHVIKSISSTVYESKLRFCALNLGLADDVPVMLTVDGGVSPAVASALDILPDDSSSLEEVSALSAVGIVPWGVVNV